MNQYSLKPEVDFSGKVVCITGASGGIGGAIAQAFAERGAFLSLIHREHAVAENLKAKGEKVLLFKGDVADPSFVESMAAETMKKWDRIDIVINAAATLGPVGILSETDVEGWMRVLKTNLYGTYLMMHEVLPFMMAARKGKIINFSGGGGAYSYPRFTAYASTKAAIVRLTETVADEVASYGIQANVVAPGAVETDMLAKVRAAGGEVKTVVSVEEPVKLVLFLASSFSDTVTGRFIHSRDDYWSFGPDLAKELDLYKLRRVQK
jgi:NAD(P)-dependent dehydrogenase (short-subunit alcohol dehydrogenase family)